MPWLLRLELWQAQFFPYLARSHHEFFFRQRQGWKVGFARGVDQDRGLAVVVAARRMSRHHADGRGAEWAVADDLEILVRLRAVRDRPGDGDGIFHVNV